LQNYWNIKRNRWHTITCPKSPHYVAILRTNLDLHQDVYFAFCVWNSFRWSCDMLFMFFVTVYYLT